MMRRRQVSNAGPRKTKMPTATAMEWRLRRRNDLHGSRNKACIRNSEKVYKVISCSFCAAEGHSPEYFQRIWPSQWSSTSNAQGWSVQPSSQLRSYASAEPFQVGTAPKPCTRPAWTLILCAQVGCCPSA